MQVEATPASTAEGQLKAPSSWHLVPVSCTGFRSSTWETHVLADWQDTLVDGAVAGAVASTGMDEARNLLPWHIALSACASRSSESCPSISAKSTTHQLQTTKMVSARRQLHQPRGQKQPRWRRRPDTSCSKTVSGHKWLKLWQARKIEARNVRTFIC